MGQPGTNGIVATSHNIYNMVPEPDKPRCDECNEEGCENLGEHKYCTGYYRADLFRLEGE